MFSNEWDDIDDTPPSFRFYYNTFKQMNLSIRRPQKDQCSLCMYIKECKDQADISEEVMSRYDNHIAEKNKEASKQMALSNKKMKCVSFDLQAVIYLP